MIADLHLHSHHSDGELSPAALVDVVADAGVAIMALTDHDTTAGHVEAGARCDQRGIVFVPGIEMTTYAMNRVIHVLGLGIRLRDPGIERACSTARENFACNQQRWIEALEAGGAPVSWRRDFPYGAQRLPVLIERLCSLGVDDGDPRRVHASFREFFRKFPPQAYAVLPSPRAAADLIRAAGGIAILAHPYRISEDDSWRSLLDGMDGLEAMYAQYTPAQRGELLGVARSNGLLHSCGSDFHGFFLGPYANPRFEAPDELLERLTRDQR